MARPYICRSCGNKFVRGDALKCPECEAEIHLKGVPEINVEPENDIPNKIEEDIDSEINIETSVSNGEYNIISATYSAHVSIKNNRYTVRFLHNVIITGWIYCPNCKRKLMQNTNLSGSMVTSCPRCKVEITFIF